MSKETSDVRDCLVRYGAAKENELNQPRDKLRKTVIEIGKSVHTQLEQIWKTNKNASGMVRELLMIHRE